MQVNLKSGAYNIIASGEAFLFDKADRFSIELLDAHFDVRVSFVFKENESNTQTIETSVEDDGLLMTCFNFTDSGTGISSPVLVAKIADKEVYLRFWSVVDGSNQANSRRVKYTFFLKE